MIFIGLELIKCESYIASASNIGIGGLKCVRMSSIECDFAVLVVRQTAF